MRNIKSKLAILGGKKTIDKKGPHYVWPIIDSKLEKIVKNQLHKSISIYNKSGIFEIFEDSFAKFHQRKHALLCSSGTLAIHSMFVAARFGEGDEVICPAYTFFATVTPLLSTGAKPILCDCDESGNIDPREIIKKINKNTKGIIVTHMWGVPCKMDEIVSICKKNKLLLLEDCSHAHGARYKDKLVGSFGDLSAWSLQGPKNITGGEGGILTTNNSDFYYKAMLLGHYNKRCKQEIPKDHPLYKYAITGMGLKYRAHPLAISIAFKTFKELNKNLEYRKKTAKEFINKFSNTISVVGFSPNLSSSWYALIFKYKPEKLNGLSIDKFFEALQAEGLVEVDRPGSTSPLNLLPLFQNPSELFPVYKKYPFFYKPGDFPVAEKFYESIIKIPVWANSKDKNIVKLYIKGIEKVIKNHKDLL